MLMKTISAEDFAANPIIAQLEGAVGDIISIQAQEVTESPAEETPAQ